MPYFVRGSEYGVCNYEGYGLHSGGMAYRNSGPSLGSILWGFVVVLALLLWGLYELCYAIAEAFE